jgi:hypothetical protein
MSIAKRPQELRENYARRRRKGKRGGEEEKKKRKKKRYRSNPLELYLVIINNNKILL